MYSSVEFIDFNKKSNKQVNPSFVSIQHWGVFGLIALMFTTFIVLLVSHANLAILKNRYYQALASDNSVTIRKIQPVRGVIVDSTGRKLAENELAYDLYFNPLYITIDKVIEHYPQLKDKIEKRREVLKKIPTNYSYEQLLVHKIEKDLAIQIKLDHIKGVYVRETSFRKYPYKNMISHVLGYTGIVYAEDLKKNPNLDYDDIIGKAGIEYFYDKNLRGKKGRILVETNAYGEKIAELTNSYVPPQNGATLKLFMNVDWQKYLYESLAHAVEQYHARGGAGIIMDVNTGGIIAMTSYPSYDNNLFIGGIDTKTYNKLAKDKRYPLLNRAIGAQEPAGSTFKTIVASAALQEKAITPTTVFNSTGVIYLSGHYPFQEYHKHVYGRLTVRDALMVSSNIFFCKTMLKLGIDKFIPYAEKFGIGEYTGIDLPGEAKGRLPSPENKIWLAKHGYTWLEPIWYPEGDACNSAIGQGITLVTPIQLVKVASTIANGGTVYKPHLVKEFIYSDDSREKYTPVVEHKDFVSPQNIKIVQEGMRMSVGGPRAIIRVLNNLPVTVAAKTGTAEFGIKTKDGYSTTHAWVIGFWPYEKPKYAFVVFLEGGGPSYRAAQVMANTIKRIYK